MRRALVLLLPACAAVATMLAGCGKIMGIDDVYPEDGGAVDGTTPDVGAQESGPGQPDGPAPEEASGPDAAKDADAASEHDATMPDGDAAPDRTDAAPADAPAEAADAEEDVADSEADAMETGVPCNATTCATGCCSGSTCVLYASQSAAQCGTAGAACGACSSGDTCSGGACTCGGASGCAGCCSSATTCEPLANESNGSCGANGSACAQCPSGQECDTSTGQCVCDATSCPNGCCSGGACVVYGSQSASQCGAAGAACGACTNGVCDTSDGACSCNASTCAGGCCNGGTTGPCLPYASESATSCGAGGASCAPCGSGQECSTASGTCVCDAASCPSGCCSGTTCVLYGLQTSSQCGTAGAACAACSTGDTCSSGQCSATPAYGSYVALGSWVPGVWWCSTSAEVYGAGSSTWTSTPAPPSLCSPGFAILGNGKWLLAGGGPNDSCTDNSTTTNAAELYDPSTGAWSSTGSMNYGRNGFTVVTLPNGNAMAIGGCSGSCSGPNAQGQSVYTVGPTVEIYDQKAGTWSLTGNLSHVRAGWVAAIALPNGSVLACGGDDAFSTWYSDCDLYNPATNSWSPTGSLSEPTTGPIWSPPVRLTDGQILLITDGVSSTPCTPELYDPTAGTWTTTSAMTTTQCQANLVALPNGNALALGGWNTNPIASVELYNPSTNIWTAAGTLQKNRSGGASRLLPKGQVLVAGGCSVSSPTACTTVESSAEIYDPSTQTSAPTASMANARFNFPLLGPTYPTCTEYASDANTVLLEHFDGSLSSGGSVLAYNVAAPCPSCGSSLTSVTPVDAYIGGPSTACGQALQLGPPANETCGATYLQWNGQQLSQTNGTLEFWIYATTYSGWGEFVRQGPTWDSCAGITFSMHISASGVLSTGTWAGCGSSDMAMDSGSNIVPLNTWTHVATSWGSQGGKLYIDDQLVGSSPCTGYPAPGYGGNLLIDLNTGADLPSAIDELRVSNVQRTFP